MTQSTELAASPDLSFLFRDSEQSARLGQDPSRPAVLEVVQVWEDTVLEVRHLRPGGRDLTLGGDHATFAAPTEDLPAAMLSLFRSEGGGFLLQFSDRWEGFLQDEQGQQTPLSALGGRARPVSPGLLEVEIPARSTVWIDTGHVVFAARHVPPGYRPPVALSDRLDPATAGMAGFSALLALVLGVLIGTAPAASTELATMKVPERIAVVLQAPPPEPDPVLPKPAASNKPEGEKAKGKEGRVGEKQAKMKSAKGDRRRMDKAQLDQQIASEAGLLGHMADEGLSGVFGDSALPSLTEGLGTNVLGAKGVQMGSNGLSSRGNAIGGGGRAEGIGGLNGRGRGDGDGRYGEPGGPGGIEKREGKMKNASNEVITMGALDKALVDKVVKQHMSALRYCYQRELTKSPDLSGKVSVRFVIGADGSVSKASVHNSSMKNLAVESCMTDRFLRMRFPEPKGGGVVIVTYPFYFSAQ